MHSLHHKRPKSTSGLRILKIAKKVNGHGTYPNSFLNGKMKVLQLTVNVEFFAVLESGENSKKAIIIPYGQEILPCHLKGDIYFYTKSIKELFLPMQFVSLSIQSWLRATLIKTSLKFHPWE